MSKVLIDRELAERVCHVDNSTRQTARRELRTILATPSGTPAMPVKAYYHEAPNEYGGFNKSVGLEVRKGFADEPLVLESDAQAIIDGLRGEIEQQAQRIGELEGLLREVAASLAWNAHGECRAIHDGPIMPSKMAIDAAKAALSADHEPKQCT